MKSKGRRETAKQPVPEDVGNERQPLFSNFVTKGMLGKRGTRGSYLVRIQFVPGTKTTPNYTNYAEEK